MFVLNVLAFILVGFQLKSIAARATGATGARYAAVAAVVCIVVILARITWVTGAAAFSRWRCRPRADGTPGPHDAVALTARGAAVVGWCGMRGTVTLAAALALPTGGDGVPFPYRDLTLVTAFGVVLGTLVLQGLTLRPLLLRLRLEDDGTVDREVRLARVETLRAAVAAIAACPGRSGGASWRSGRTARSETPRSSAWRRSSTGRNSTGRNSSGRGRGMTGRRSPWRTASTSSCFRRTAAGPSSHRRIS